MSADLIPGRPASDPAQGCPFCLDNGLLKGELIVEGDYGYVALVADDLALLCPYTHFETDFWNESEFFTAEFFRLLGWAVNILTSTNGWVSYNWGANVGYAAGQRVCKDPDGEYRHPHIKIMRRDDSQRPSHSWGLDALARMVDNCPHVHTP
jgi:hypothetical protein